MDNSTLRSAPSSSMGLSSHLIRDHRNPRHLSPVHYDTMSRIDYYDAALDDSRNSLYIPQASYDRGMYEHDDIGPDLGRR